MSKMVQIRNMPEALHRRLKARAARLGMSLSDYMLRELKLVAERPTLDEMLERLASRPPAPPGFSPTEMLREERDSR